MATEKAAIRITELDFLSIRENLKTFLRSQSEFQDFDFEGSGMSVLLDVLAYNTHYMAIHLNMSANEMFLDSAQLRASVLSHAKLIGYVPASAQGALSKINIKVTPSQTENQELGTITLNKYTRLLGYDKDGINYPFVTLYTNTAIKTGNSFDFSNVFIKQGEVVTLQYIMRETNTSRRFEIPSANVDTTTIQISTRDNVSDTNTTIYKITDDITTITRGTPAVFLEENENYTYTFYFGDDVIGRRPKDGSVIICTYLNSVGSVSNNIRGFTFTEAIGGEFRDNIAVTSVVSSYGGSEKETIEQVKFRAPHYYTTQNRAVSKTDYEVLLVKDYNYIESVSVWGGEEADPVVYGKVFVSIKTKGNYELTDFEKEYITGQLIKTRNVVTITPEIVNPDYVYIGLKGNITYDPKLTDKTANEILQFVKAAIQDYSDIELNDFKSYFRKSKLMEYIENSEPSITGTDIDIFVQKRFRADLTNTKNYEIPFNMPLQQQQVYDRLFTFPDFQVYDINTLERNVFIEEVPETKTGIKTIQVTNGGRNYTTPPTVRITGDGRGAAARARVVSGKVNSIDIIKNGADYSIANIRLVGGDGTGAIAVANLEAKQGRLRLVYYKPDGQKVIMREDAGTINYDTGKLTLNTLRINSVTENDFYNENYITVNIMSSSDIIAPLRNRILTIDNNDPKSIRLEVIAQ
jgi:hypothetical protein